MLMVDGYGEKRVAWEEKRKRKKKKKKKRKEMVQTNETGQSKWEPPCQYIYGNAIENIVIETENS